MGSFLCWFFLSSFRFSFFFDFVGWRGVGFFSRFLWFSSWFKRPCSSCSLASREWWLFVSVEPWLDGVSSSVTSSQQAKLPSSSNYGPLAHVYASCCRSHLLPQKSRLSTVRLEGSTVATTRPRYMMTDPVTGSYHLLLVRILGVGGSWATGSFSDTQQGRARVRFEKKPRDKRSTKRRQQREANVIFLASHFLIVCGCKYQLDRH